jgi:hypothetical protein
MILATQREQGAKIAILGYFGVSRASKHRLEREREVSDRQIVIADILQPLFTGTFPSGISCIGMAVIVVVGVWCIVGLCELSRANWAAQRLAEGSREDRG